MGTGEKKGLSFLYSTTFWIAAAITFAFGLWGIVFPDVAEKTFSTIQRFLINNFGWGYLISVAGFVVFGILLSLSKYGNIRLGKDDEKPEFSILSWFAMLFAAGMGIGLVFWSVAEPITHYVSPPFGNPKTPEAAQLALRYTFFHWGLHPWATYAIVGLAMAYCQFRCGLPALVSSTLYPLIGEKGVRGWIGKLIDILATFATVFGVATSLGLGAIQINSGLSYVCGVPKADYVSVLIICVITVLFILSAVTGIRKGIKFFSQINMVLVFFLMMVIVFGGPTKFILDNLTNTIGGYFQNIIQMSFWTDPYGVNPGWVGSWTIFYWAWWIAWAPFVGAFIARISRGRTVREFIWGVLIAPALLSFLWMGITGSSALYVEINKGNIAPQVSKDVGVALFALLHNLNLPFPTLLSCIAMVLIAIFFITSADSATFVMSMLTSGGDLEPPSVVRIIWGVIEALVAIALLVAGGLTALQTASIASAFPFMLVMIVMCVAILKSFRQELGKGGL